MYNEIQKIFSIKLEDFDLIRIALTHPSYTQSYNLPETECYERLEFLGDAMLSILFLLIYKYYIIKRSVFSDLLLYYLFFYIYLYCINFTIL